MAISVILLSAGIYNLRVSRQQIISHIDRRDHELGQTLIDIQTVHHEKATDFLDAILDATNAQSLQHVQMASDTSRLLNNTSNILDTLKSNEEKSHRCCAQRQQNMTTRDNFGSSHLLLVHSISQDSVQLLQLTLHIIRSLLQ